MKIFFKHTVLATMVFTAGYIQAQTTGQLPKPEKVADGIIVPVGDNFLKVEFWSDSIVRVVSGKDRAFFAHSTPATQVRQKEKTKWKLATENNVATLTTDKLQVKVDLATGAVSFFDAKGQPVLAEKSGGRMITPADVQNEKTFHVEQQWAPNADESLYGMGQLQFGITDIKGYDLDLWQHNTCVVVPLLVSSRGYGVFWDNLSFTRFGDLRDWEPIPTNCLFDVTGQSGGLTTGTFTAANPDELQNSRVVGIITAARGGRGGGRGGSSRTRWVGEVVPPTTGVYQFRTYSNGGMKMWFDGKLVVDRWRQGWLTENDQVKVPLEAGHHYAIKIEFGGDQASTMRLTWKTPSPDDSTTLWSEVGDGVDYYFIYGPAIDQVVAGFRQLTGQASMMPEWSFGLWQSRQRYETSQQSLDVLNEYRQRAIPFDNIVQDWQYWPRDAWGSHLFDPQRFPDPVGWINAIHAQHAHVMISVWGKFYTGTANFNAMQKAGFLYQPDLDEGAQDWIGFPFTFYDAFNPAARQLYWDQINTNLFNKGIDAWWEDATEPDVTSSPPTLERSRAHILNTAMGTASRVINGYALMNSMGMYEGQRSVAPNQRVFILTRSGFAGIQRYGTATWSGDTTSTWGAMAKQIAAGLGYSVSGTPYWTMDIGGYTHDSGTMMRPFIMDFPQDAAARESADEYMFGPAFLVAPVTVYKARTIPVYLPQNDAGWYDFWTGVQTAGGQTIQAPAPFDAMPLFIRPGSIIPYGPDVQYTGEKPADPITLYVYTGADGTFSLYEDDGLTYNYEKGAFAWISFQWDNATRTLTIGKCEGKFAGMLAKRTFNIVLVSKDKPVGYSPTPVPDKTVSYQGGAVKVRFN